MQGGEIHITKMMKSSSSYNLELRLPPAIYLISLIGPFDSNTELRMCILPSIKLDSATNPTQHNA